MRSFSLFAGLLGCTAFWFAGCVGDDPAAGPSLTGDSGTASSGGASSGTNGDAASGSSSSSGGNEDAGGDAEAPAPTGDLVWELHSDRAGSAVELPSVSTALVGGEERIVLATIANQAITFGASSYPAGSGHMALASFAGDKSLRSLTGFGGATNRIAPHAVALDSAGNIYLVGTFQGASLVLSPNITLVNANGNTDLPAGFYAKLSPTGALRWAKEISATGAEDSSCDAIAVRGTAVAIACSHDGAASIELANGGGGANTTPIAGATNDRDVLVMSLDPESGVALWHKPLRGVGGHDRPGGLAFDTQGNLLVVGQLNSPSLTNEVGVKAVEKTGAAGTQGFLLRFTAATPHQVNLSKAWGGGSSVTAAVQPYALANLPNDDVVVCGTVSNDPDLGRGNITTRGGTDAFVMRLNGGLAATTWVQTYGDGQNDSCQSVASTPEGDVVVGGMHRAGEIQLAGKALLPAVGSVGGHVARLAAADGVAQWARSFVLVNEGTPTAATVGGVSVLAGGDIVVTGAWTGAMDLGAGPIQSPNGGQQTALYAVRLKR